MDTIKNIDIIIISMIICATIIALAAIYFNHLFEKKAIETIEAKGAKEAIDNFQSKKMIKIHRNYIAGFLGFAIIMLISSQYADCDELLKYLSFASTITSFVLSILAIFVTVQSSSDLYKQFARIEDATTTIKSLSETIKKDLPNISKAGEDIQKTSSKLSDKLDSVVDSLVEIFDEKLENRIAKTEDCITKQLESLNKSSDHIEQPQNLTDTVSLDTLKKYFLSITSTNGLLAIYACSLSKDNNKKEFELSKLFEGNEAYIYGFLIATVSSQFIQLTDDSRKSKMQCIDSEFECTEIKNAIKKRKYKEEQRIINKINIIHEHFGELTISSIDEL